MCHLYSAELTPQCLVELQFRNRLCIDTRIVQQPIMPSTILRCDPHARITLLRFLAGEVAVACYRLFPSRIDANFFAWLRQVLVSTPRAGLSKGVCQTW